MKIFHITNIPPKVEGVCDACNGELYQRGDDKEETIRERLQVYQKQTAPLVDYYKGSGKLVQVSGDDAIDEVYASICRSLS